MTRFASPALGCQLRLVEVQIGTAKETYDPEHFNEPLELSLEGQRSLGSNCGILSLLITTGTRQMLSIRLNDLLSHPNGTGGMICVDKGKHQLCVKLPNRDHTLRVWFVEERDFLITVCILRKSGFQIDQGKIQHRDTGTTTPASQPLPFSSTTPLTILTAQAKSLSDHDPVSFPTRKPRGDNIFDEVLESLERLSGDSKLQNAVQGHPLSESLGPHDLSYLNPYNAFSTKRKATLNQPNVGSPLKKMVNQEQRHQNETERWKATRTAPKPPLRYTHRYFTRSFSSARHEAQQNTNLRTPPSSLTVQRNASASVGELYPDSTPGRLSTSFTSSPAASLTQLMPRRRKLPFSTHVKNTDKKLRPASRTAEIDPCREAKTPQVAPGMNSPDMTIILSHLASLDKLDQVSCKIFDQYEKDIARGCDEHQVAPFYLEQLHITRCNFWLNELLKASNSHHTMMKSIQHVTST